MFQELSINGCFLCHGVIPKNYKSCLLICKSEMVQYCEKKLFQTHYHILIHINTHEADSTFQYIQYASTNKRMFQGIVSFIDYLRAKTGQLKLNITFQFNPITWAKIGNRTKPKYFLKFFFHFSLFHYSNSQNKLYG